MNRDDDQVSRSRSRALSLPLWSVYFARFRDPLRFLNRGALHVTISLVAIQNIRHGGLKRFFEHRDARRLPQGRLSRIAGILAKLDKMAAIADMDQHDYRLHPLKGDRKGYWSVRVSANWRITFRV